MFVKLTILLVLAVIAQYLLYKRQVMQNLRYSCSWSTEEAYEGDTVQMVETLHNNKLLPLPWVEVNIATTRWMEFPGSRFSLAQESQDITSSYFMGSYQKTVRRWEVKCLKRGHFGIDDATLVAGDLTGLYVTSQHVPIHKYITVFPQLIPIEQMLTPKSFQWGDNILRQWSLEDPFLFSGLREYMPWDTMNRIHWGTSARTGQLMVRQHEHTSRYPLTIVLNVQSTEYESREAIEKELVEWGIKTTATFLDRALQAGLPVRLAANGRWQGEGRKTIFTRQGAGREHVVSLLTILAHLELENTRDIEGFLQQIHSQLHQEHILLITAYLNAGLVEEITRLQADHRVTVVFVGDAVDAVLPQGVEWLVLQKAGDDHVG